MQIGTHVIIAKHQQSLFFPQIHAFEVVPELFLPPHDVIAALPHPPNVTRYEMKVGVSDEANSSLGVPGVDILRFITGGLRIREEDTLIVKMDVEGGEVSIGIGVFGRWVFEDFPEVC